MKAIVALTIPELSAEAGVSIPEHVCDPNLKCCVHCYTHGLRGDAGCPCSLARDRVYLQRRLAGVAL